MPRSGCATPRQAHAKRSIGCARRDSYAPCGACRTPGCPYRAQRVAEILIDCLSPLGCTLAYITPAFLALNCPHQIADWYGRSDKAGGGMNVRIKSSEITPEHVYISRRNFMKGLGISAASALLLAACGPQQSAGPVSSNSQAAAGPTASQSHVCARHRQRPLRPRQPGQPRRQQRRRPLGPSRYPQL